MLAYVVTEEECQKTELLRKCSYSIKLLNKIGDVTKLEYDPILNGDYGNVSCCLLTCIVFKCDLFKL